MIANGVWLLRSCALLVSCVTLATPALLMAQARAATKPAAKAATKKPAAAAPPAVRIDVVGLRLVGQPVGTGEYGDVTAFGVSPGIEVALGVRVPEGYVIVESDEDESTVATFVDDQGTNLATEVSFAMSPDFTQDRSAMVTSVRADTAVSPEARQLTLTGALHVQTARGEQATRVKAVTLAKGQTFKVGAASYLIEEVEAEDEWQSLLLAMTRAELMRIKALRVYDAAGAPVEADQSMRGYSMDAGQLMYRLPSTLKTATIEIVHHENLATQQVPFSLTVGLGSAR